MAYNSETDVVSGTMTLSTYCITGSNRTFTPPTVDVTNGTDNIFFSKVFFPTIIGKDDTEGTYTISGDAITLKCKSGNTQILEYRTESIRYPYGEYNLILEK